MYHKNSETLRCSQHFFGGRQKCKILLTEDAAGAIKAHVGADYHQLGRGFTTWDDLLLQFTVTTNFNVDTAVEPGCHYTTKSHTPALNCLLRHSFPKNCSSICAITLGLCHTKVDQPQADRKVKINPCKSGEEPPRSRTFQPVSV